MNNQKVHIYFIPGLSASPKIFENLTLSNRFECHYLNWLIPYKKEAISDYAKRFSQQITHKNCVLIGVSFGGILAQEITPFISCKKVIIISSIKNSKEFPKRLKYIRIFGFYKLFPLGLINNLEQFSVFLFGKKIKKRVELYKKYLSVRDKNYLKWALKSVLHWQSHLEINNLIHIHGTQDHLFPIANINNCIPVKNGTHAMIIYKAKTIGKIIEEQV